MKRRAFTLVELLTVIAIIAILAGLLVPALGKALGSGRASACASNQKQFGMAFAMFNKAHNDYYPPAFLTQYAYEQGNLYTQMALANYGDLAQRLFHGNTPLNLGSSGSDNGDGIAFANLLKAHGVTADLAACQAGGAQPGTNDRFLLQGNYGMNMMVGDNNTAKAATQLLRPSAVYVMMDMGCVTTGLSGSYQMRAIDFNGYPAYVPGTKGLTKTDGSPSYSRFAANDFANGRHNKGVNALYGDGHVQAQTGAQLNQAAVDAAASGATGAWAITAQ